MLVAPTLDGERLALNTSILSHQPRYYEPISGIPERAPRQFPVESYYESAIQRMKRHMT